MPASDSILAGTRCRGRWLFGRRDAARWKLANRPLTALAAQANHEQSAVAMDRERDGLGFSGNGTKCHLRFLGDPIRPQMAVLGHLEPRRRRTFNVRLDGVSTKSDTVRQLKSELSQLERTHDRTPNIHHQRPQIRRPSKQATVLLQPLTDLRLLAP